MSFVLILHIHVDFQTNSRYAPRTSSFGISSNTANRTSSDSSTSSPSASAGGTYQTYRKSTTPSILKKYSNFSLPGSVDKNSDGKKSNTNDKLASKDCSKITSSIPRCRPSTKYTAYESTESQGLRYGSSSRFGGQIARSPIKEKALPVFGVSATVCRRSESKERSPEKTLFVTRATSPTPPSHSSFLRSRRMDNDDVLLSEICNTTSIEGRRQSVGCQTEENETNKAPTPPSRVASLSTKFTSIGNSGSGRYASITSAYRCPRPTDLPIRNTSLARSAYHSPTEKASPNESSAERSSFSLHSSYNPSARTPSPLAALNKSLSTLAIENSKPRNDDDSDTENESSYDEDYPIKSEKDRYSFITTMVGQSIPASELSDKPPKYPLSPINAKCKPIVREAVANDDRTLSVRSSSAASSAGSCEEDVSEKGCGNGNGNDNDKYIPLFNAINDGNNNIRTDAPAANAYNGEREYDSNVANKPHFARKTDSDDDFGYRIRKMDSADSPWWCKTPDSESLSDRNQEHCRQQRSDCSRSSGGDASDKSARPFGYAIRKMDSADAPWWCNSEEDSRSSRSQADPTKGNRIADTGTEDSVSTASLSNYKIRKMDSSELLWNCNSEASNKTDLNDDNPTEVDWWKENDGHPQTNSSPSIPEWWNGVKNEDQVDGCVENYKTNKILRVKKIELVKKVDIDNRCDTPNGYKITKIDSGDEAWWLNEEKQETENRGNGGFQNPRGGTCEPQNEHNNSFSADNYKLKYVNELDNLLLYIGDHTNIDELLGTEVPPPAAPVTPTGDDSSTEDELSESMQLSYK